MADLLLKRTTFAYWYMQIVIANVNYEYVMMLLI